MWNSGFVETVVSLPINDAIRDRLRDMSTRYHFNYVKPTEFSDVPKDQWAKTDVLITDKKLPAPQETPNLKWVQFFQYYNLDEIISYQDIHPATTFTSAEGANLHQVVLACLHGLTAPGKYHKPLYKTTIGIIGYDSIGRELARILKTFQCTVLASTFNAMDPTATTFLPQNIGDHKGEFFDRLYPMQALASMLPECDFVINTLSLSTKSKGKISKKEIQHLKKGTTFVDVSHHGVTIIDDIDELVQNRGITILTSDDLELLLPSSSLFIATYLDLLYNNMRRFLDNTELLNQIT